MGVAADHKINFYNINHLDFGIIFDSGMPFAADQLVFQNRGFTVVYNDFLDRQSYGRGRDESHASMLGMFLNIY